MERILFSILISLLMPASVFAANPTATQEAPASFSAAHSLLASSSAPGNAYTAGVSVVVTAPTAGDLSAVGGSIVAAGPVAGDGLLLGGSIRVRAPIAGDLRVIGAKITIVEPVAGDLVAVGYSVNDDGRADGSVFITAVNASVSNGARGPVTVYSNDVFLSGEFSGDVSIVAGGPGGRPQGTVDRGELSYEAPETAQIPSSAMIAGGTEYINASYLPDAGTSRILAFASVGVFLLIRILGALILAGLLAGLFPDLARAVTERVYTGRVRSIFLTALLGFATLVAMPILFVLLALTFVGVGVALLLFVAYALLVALAFVYAGILLGTMFVRRFVKRDEILWHDGVLGMLALSLIALVPVIGWLVVLFLSAFTAGALLLLFFHFAFPQEEPAALLP